MDNLRILRGVWVGAMTRFVLSKKEPLRAKQEAFLSAVRNNCPALDSGEDGLKVLALAKSIVLSAAKHRIINTGASL